MNLSLLLWRGSQPRARTDHVAGALTWLSALLLLVFLALPLLAMLGKALCDKSEQWVGLANFAGLLSPRSIFFAGQ